jgi:uncharacterized protein YerC
MDVTAWTVDPGARAHFWTEPARSERQARASSIPRESIEQYKARGGVVRVITQVDVDRRQAQPEAPQIRRAPSLHPENRKILRRQERKSGTEEQRAQALAMLREGRKQREISTAIGISQWTVGQIARDAGLGRRMPGPGPSTTAEQNAEAIRRLREGETHEQISAAMNVSPSVVKRIAIKNGLRRKDAQGRPVREVEA